MDEPILEEEEKWIVLQALKCLHQLKYVADLAVIGQENRLLLEQLIEEIVKIREIMEKE